MAQPPFARTAAAQYLNSTPTAWALQCSILSVLLAPTPTESIPTATERILKRRWFLAPIFSVERVSLGRLWAVGQTAKAPFSRWVRMALILGFCTLSRL